MHKSLRGDIGIEQLTEIYEQERDSQIKQRLLAIKLLYQGKRATEIAKDLSVSYKTIYNWIDLWNEAGTEGLKPKSSRAARKGYMDLSEWEQVVKEIDGLGYTLQDVIAYVEKTRGKTYSYKGAWKILRQQFQVKYGKPYVIIGKQSEPAEQDLKKTRIGLA